MSRAVHPACVPASYQSGRSKSVWNLFWLILGLLGLGGVRGIIGFIFGGKKLEFDFKIVASAAGENLVCEFRNSPVRNLVMKLLFMSRPKIDSMAIRCEVLDRSETEARIGEPFLVDMTDVDGNTSKQLSVPPSVFPLSFTLVSYDGKSDAAVLLNTQTRNTQDKNTPLLSGVLYLLRLTVLAGDKEIKSHLSGFIIKNRVVLIKRLTESLSWGYRI